MLHCKFFQTINSLTLVFHYRSQFDYIEYHQEYTPVPCNYILVIAYLHYTKQSCQLLMQSFEVQCTNGTPEGFLKAIDILLNKPHVLNRRLCGTKTVFSNVISSPSSICTLANIFLNLHSKLRLDIADVLKQKQVLELIFDSKINNISSYPFNDEQLSAISDKCHEDVLKYEIFVRDLLPRDLTKFYSLRELVILGNLHKNW